MEIKTPDNLISDMKNKVGIQAKTAFLSAFVIGILIHLPIMVSDIPNHDGLDSMWFDQNMITSGRWFLTVACGISSYFAIPWLIGVLAMLYLGIASALLVQVLKVKDKCTIVLMSAMLVAFPSIASNFAYVFTMDGYMLGVMFAILAVWCVQQHKLGFVFGAVALAFSMGIYQSYLPVAMILCVYCVADLIMGSESMKYKTTRSLRYLYMGAIGVALYYIVLRILLLIQGKELADYQGINNMTANTGSILSSVKSAYMDFFTFTLKSHVVAANVWAMAAVVLLLICFVVAFVLLVIQKKWHKSPFTYLLVVLVLVVLPIITNVIYIVSPGVTYHLLMRYQWTFFGIIAVAFISRTMQSTDIKQNISNAVIWVSVLSAFVMVFSYAVSDNIAYSNLQKKYEKTYAYCLRLADRMEQTEGYYQGIPIGIVGVVSEDSYPVTDITDRVTGNMIGMNGDYLLYTGKNYELFFKYFLGITIHVLPDESVAKFYYSDEYATLNSFPSKESMKVIDGVLYIKTENNH